MTLLKETIHRKILQIIEDHANKITSRDLEKIIVQRISVGRRKFQAALKALIAEGELAYTYLYGCTFIEKSFNRPVRVGSQVILTPPERHPMPKDAPGRSITTISDPLGIGWRSGGVSITCDPTLTGLLKDFSTNVHP